MELAYTAYEVFKRDFDRVMTRAVGNFVEIGYLLKVARDTDILASSQYSTMGEFAQANYKISESQASRFIAIADQYGDGSGSLLPQYRQYSYSLLTEMLTLPGPVAEAITPDMTRDEVREIKSVVAEEEKISDIEVLIEEKMGTGDLLVDMLQLWLHENPDVYKQIYESAEQADAPGGSREVMEGAYAPHGVAILSARIPGTGAVMLSFKGGDELPVLIQVRSQEKRKITWEELDEATSYIMCRGMTLKESWAVAYGEDFPEPSPAEDVRKEDKAPAGQQEAQKPKKPEKKVKVARAQEKSVQKPTESVRNEAESVQRAPENDHQDIIDARQPEEPAAAAGQSIEDVMPAPEEDTISGWPQKIMEQIRRLREILQEIEGMKGRGTDLQVREIRERYFTEAKALNTYLMLEEDDERRTE